MMPSAAGIVHLAGAALFDRCPESQVLDAVEQLTSNKSTGDATLATSTALESWIRPWERVVNLLRPDISLMY